ncbi:hypothetical protein SLEP1_g26746 [Rubroshorea leprosula]|uniref:Uncharacterized protein n=1 Tax=Rubroshorea leprosula TaxID=152421 RepID=A0AAV5JZA5_9ROSI|nr:hypothetical protein SLEP1_g26746 [Rubroshorea leprosula]
MKTSVFVTIKEGREHWKFNYLLLGKRAAKQGFTLSGGFWREIYTTDVCRPGNLAVTGDGGIDMDCYRI